ncbi:leucine-rich repeat-containing protein 56-like [Pollicipes pollicipes]|uniref:leucine-rich repeat-containing protein 56-like n=1 Tax=Pollicipes pollicipes TaxID=41117 RepID=UPI00188570F9|nr:leucine-rich repeat-containing protein 56-like [Pollicipes pollicipes]
MVPPRRANEEEKEDAADGPRLVHITAATELSELQRQLGTARLEAVRAVSLTSEPESAGGLSWALQRLPRLQELRLLRTALPGGLRAFGSGLFQLRVLWMVGCQLTTLDGVCALPRLRELYVARNQLDDVSVCSCLEQLQVLDVEDNQLSESVSLMFLRACSELCTLELRGNPLCSDRTQLQQLPDWLPQLQTLNGELTETGRKLLRRLQRPALKVNTWMAAAAAANAGLERKRTGECT